MALEKTGDVAFANRGKLLQEQQSETSRLIAEVRRLKEENTIHKKTAVFFAKALD
ncbi:hypothetical protein N9R09_02460 [Porticoccaceae bacterium]|nr:hypothetical protein [Porticoccaceae bacterium]